VIYYQVTGPDDMARIAIITIGFQHLSRAKPTIGVTAQTAR